MAPPRVTVHEGRLVDADAPVLAVLVSRTDDGPVPDPVAGEVAAALGLDLSAELARAKVVGKAGEAVSVPVRIPVPSDPPAPEVLLLVGADDGSPRALRRAGAAVARRCTGREAVAVAVPAGTPADGVRALAEGLALAAYAKPGRRAPEPAKAPVGAATLHVRDDAAVARDAARAATVTATAAHRARDLANTPSDLKDPAWLAAEASRFGAQAGVEVSVRDERALAAEAFGGVLAVGSGSARPPRLVEMSYLPAGRARRRAPHVVLVGKGITFDTGGLSLKPREAMLPMKTDMTGGGVVIAVLSALRDLAIPVRVTGLVPAAENMPGAAAYRPGDVVTHYGGRTSEIFNTDAEGRIVLADALAYADARLDPDVLIDIATLTGAASLGLGRRHAALYANDDGLAAELLGAAETSGEQLWRMPLVEDYRFALDSDVADVAHISRVPDISGGSITAALFLQEFVGARRWAHLDIAGPARADSDEHEVTKGGTGFGARLLLRWLESLAR